MENIEKCDETGLFSQRYSFRIVGIPSGELAYWKRLLKGLYKEPVRTMVSKDLYVVCVDLVTEDMASLLLDRLKGVHISYSHGVWVSFVSVWAANRMEVPEYVLKVFSALGGSFDFAFTAVLDEE